MKDRCRDLMHMPVELIRPDQSLHDALERLQRHQTQHLYAVDHHGNFVGLFTAMTLLERVLPQSVSIHMGNEVGDLNFMRTSVEELQTALDALHNTPITAFLIQREAPILRPDDSIMEALFLTHKHQKPVVILAENSRQFLGAISTSNIIDALVPHSP